MPVRTLPEVPTEFENDRIVKVPLVAAITGDCYETALGRVKAGKYGPIYKIGERELGVKLGNLRRAIEESVVEAA